MAAARNRRPRIRPMPDYAETLRPGDRNIWVFTGHDAARRARFRLRLSFATLVLPGHEPDPEHWLWPVRGTEPLVLDFGSSDAWRRNLAGILIKAGADLVVVSAIGDPSAYFSLRPSP